LCDNTEQGKGKIRGVIKALDKVESLNDWIGRIVSVALYILAAVMLYEVIARYIFNSPTSWAFELSSFLFVYVSFLCGGYVLLHKGHVNVDIFYKRLSPRGRAILDLFTSLFFFLFAGVILWQGTKLFMNSIAFWEHSTLTVWAPPVYPIKLVVPIGAALILVQGLVKFIKDIMVAIRGEIWI